MKTWKPTTAGILMIIAGITEATIGITGAIISGTIAGYTVLPVLGGIWAFTIALIALGIVAIAGGICSLKRRIWGIALAGSICSLFGISFALGILAIIFVSMGKEEFFQRGASLS